MSRGRTMTRNEAQSLKLCKERQSPWSYGILIFVYITVPSLRPTSPRSYKRSFSSEPSRLRGITLFILQSVSPLSFHASFWPLALSLCLLIVKSPEPVDNTNDSHYSSSIVSGSSLSFRECSISLGRRSSAPSSHRPRGARYRGSRREKRR